jgi:hypothetical protein
VAEQIDDDEIGARANDVRARQCEQLARELMRGFGSSAPAGLSRLPRGRRQRRRTAAKRDHVSLPDLGAEEEGAPSRGHQSYTSFRPSTTATTRADEQARRHS